MLFLEHTSFGRRERERERLTVDTFQKGGLWIFSLSLARAKKKKKKKKKRWTEEAPVAHLPTDASSSSSSSSFYRPTDRKERRKKENARGDASSTGKKDRRQMVAKGIMCWRENRVEFKKTKIKKVSIAYRRLFFFLFPHLAVLLSHTSEKTKKTKTCRSLSLSFFPSRRSTFVKSNVVLLNPLEDVSSTERKRRKRKEIFFSNTYKTLNSTASFFCCWCYC